MALCGLPAVSFLRIFCLSRIACMNREMWFADCVSLFFLSLLLPFSLLSPPLLLPPHSLSLFFLFFFLPLPLSSPPSVPPPSLTPTTIQSVGKQTSLNRQSGRPVAWGFWLANTYVEILLRPLYCLKTHNC